MNIVTKDDESFVVKSDGAYFDAACITAKPDGFEILAWESNGACVGITVTNAEAQALLDWLKARLRERLSAGTYGAIESPTK